MKPAKEEVKKEVEETTEKEEVTEDMDLDVIAHAEQVVADVKSATKELRVEVRKMQKLKMESILGGKAQTNIKPAEAETAVDYVKKVEANEDLEKKS